MAVAFPQYDRLKRLRRMYGEKFPDINEKDPKKLSLQWKEWLEGQREAQEPAMRDRRLHWARHRNFRIGNQHISTRDGRTWKVPSEDKNQIRRVLNIFGPSLDFRHGVIAEQRPGFRHELMKATIDARERAEAQQATAEYYFHKLKVWRQMRDAIYNAQTDGVCFLQVYLDKDAGPLVQNARQVLPNDERYQGFVAQGYRPNPDGVLLVPLSESGQELPPDAVIQEIPQGDLACRVVLAHDTFVDPEARVLNGDGERAKWFAVRRPRDIYSARIETGDPDLKAETLEAMMDPLDLPTDNVSGWVGGMPPFPTGNRSRMEEGVYDWTVYFAPNGQDIEKGMWVRMIGDKIVESADELPGGVYPFARFTDGSPDPSFYPRPTCADWVQDQITINATASLLVQHVRVNGLGRLMGLKGTLINESYNSVVGSFLEYEGMKPEQLKAQNVGGDVWQMLEFSIRKLEDKTGWNDLARGQVLGSSGGGMQDVSGRAVLGAREMLERTFGAMVQATAEGATEWAEIVVPYAAWLFGDSGRMIPTVGGRGDLAKLITREQLEGDVSVYVDPATLMPMPAQLRQQILLDLLNTGRITMAEYAKRAPYAEIRNVYMGDIDQFQRAQWVNTLIEENYEQYLAQLQADPMAPVDPMTGQPQQPSPIVLYTPGTGLPIYWQDDPAVHLSALNEIILNERKPFPMRKLAMDRAGLYEQLAQAKVDPMQPVPLEVMGVPLNRMLAQAQAQAATAVPTPQSANPGVVPGGAAMPSTAPASGLAPSPTEGSQLSAQPLGSVGGVESGSAAGQQL